MRTRRVRRSPPAISIRETIARTGPKALLEVVFRMSGGLVAHWLVSSLRLFTGELGYP